VTPILQKKSAYTQELYHRSHCKVQALPITFYVCLDWGGNLREWI